MFRILKNLFKSISIIRDYSETVETANKHGALTYYSNTPTYINNMYVGRNPKNQNIEVASELTGQTSQDQMQHS